jgi:hypothetical protein
MIIPQSGHDRLFQIPFPIQCLSALPFDAIESVIWQRCKIKHTEELHVVKAAP